MPRRVWRQLAAGEHTTKSAPMRFMAGLESCEMRSSMPGSVRDTAKILPVPQNQLGNIGANYM
jgi:hypothetical protein